MRHCTDRGASKRGSCTSDVTRRDVTCRDMTREKSFPAVNQCESNTLSRILNYRTLLTPQSSTAKQIANL